MKTTRVFIGIFGRRNQGKSALVNALAGQELSIVSDLPGTTTDPVKKTIEIFGIGPVVLVDTAGIDDTDTAIGRQRVQKSIEMLNIIDTAILVVSDNHLESTDKELISRFKATDTPFVIVHNKSEESPLASATKKLWESYGAPVVECSAKLKSGIDTLIRALVSQVPESAKEERSLLGDKVMPGDLVALVMPQDAEAPEGRLILPQVQTIRDLLDNHAIVAALQPEELDIFLRSHKPALVVTDSQVFNQVANIVPKDIPLTSFSILLARSKGHFDLFIHDTPSIAHLKDGDKILIMESCTHTTSCEDIGRHKLPTLLQKKTGKNLRFDFVAALEPLPNDLNSYALAIQCGGCMVTKKQLWNRVETVHQSGIPISNYGMALAWLTDIFERVTQIFHS